MVGFDGKIAYGTIRKITKKKKLNFEKKKKLQAQLTFGFSFLEGHWGSDILKEKHESFPGELHLPNRL